MKSVGQINGEYREVVGMCVEAVPVLGAESVDFLFRNDFVIFCIHYISPYLI
jgi:hypothetical protein